MCSASLSDLRRNFCSDALSFSERDLRRIHTYVRVGRTSCPRANGGGATGVGKPLQTFRLFIITQPKHHFSPLRASQLAMTGVVWLTTARPTTLTTMVHTASKPDAEISATEACAPAVERAPSDNPASRLARGGEVKLEAAHGVPSLPVGQPAQLAALAGAVVQPQPVWGMAGRPLGPAHPPHHVAPPCVSGALAANGGRDAVQSAAAVLASAAAAMRPAHSSLLPVAMAAAPSVAAPHDVRAPWGGHACGPPHVAWPGPPVEAATLESYIQAAHGGDETWAHAHRACVRASSHDPGLHRCAPPPLIPRARQVPRAASGRNPGGASGAGKAPRTGRSLRETRVPARTRDAVARGDGVFAFGPGGRWRTTLRRGPARGRGNAAASPTSSAHGRSACASARGRASAAAARRGWGLGRRPTAWQHAAASGQLPRGLVGLQPSHRGGVAGARCLHHRHQAGMPDARGASLALPQGEQLGEGHRLPGGTEPHQTPLQARAG